MSSFAKAKAKEKKQGSTFFRAKKYMASRLTESSMGRQTIIKFFGHSGDSLLQCVQDVACQLKGKEFASALMVDIMKVVGKVGLLYQNKTISEEAFKDVVPHLLEVASQFQYALELRDASARDMRPVADAFRKLYETTFGLIRSHMQEKNSSKLTTVCDYLSSADHLDPLLHDPDLEAHRVTMQTHISRLMDPYASEMAETNKFLRLESQKRHDKLAKLVSSPTFPSFMRDIETRQIVTSWIMTGTGGHRDSGHRDSVTSQHLYGADFYCAILDFKTVTSKPIVKTRSSQIFQKYLSPGCKKPIGVLTPTEVSEIDDTIACAEFVSKSIFDGAVNRIESLFELLFQDSFVDSDAFDGLKNELRNLELRLHIDVEEHLHEDDRHSVHDPAALEAMKGMHLK
jgi:hypothetical protein